MSSDRKRILIVDDEAGIRDSLKLLLATTFEVSVAAGGREALKLINDEAPPDLILLDVAMPDLGGLEVLRELRDRQLKVPVIMLTATQTVQVAVAAMKLGAVDFVGKPFDVDELTSLMAQTLAGGGSARDGSESVASTPGDFGTLVGRSAPMAELFHNVQQVAPRDTTVLITGESGTGKELIAREIHRLSSRARGPFVAINCAAIPESLIESELFGHERGAFTHAVERRLGHCELADKGTLFLDEIGELAPHVQVKMLRFLQEREFFRVGRSKPVSVDVRVVAATNKNLERMVKEGKFREDLFYRVNVVHLTIPPLRDRYDDVVPLIRHFIEKYAERYGNRTLRFVPEAERLLVEYEWPGNVRELENVIESLLALSTNEEIAVTGLPRRIRERIGTGLEGFGDGAGSAVNFLDAERQFEREMILKALKKTNYVQTRAAELLGISRRILKYKMDKLGIGGEEPQAN